MDDWGVNRDMQQAYKCVQCTLFESIRLLLIECVRLQLFSIIAMYEQGVKHEMVDKSHMRHIGHPWRRSSRHASRLQQAC